MGAICRGVWWRLLWFILLILSTRTFCYYFTWSLLSTFPTWILSRSLLLACSSFFWRLSSSRACCCSFCSHLMYSTEALRMVPLFQRISLPKNRKDNLFHTCCVSRTFTHRKNTFTKTLFYRTKKWWFTWPIIHSQTLRWLWMGILIE